MNEKKINDKTGHGISSDEPLECADIFFAYTTKLLPPSPQVPPIGQEPSYIRHCGHFCSKKWGVGAHRQGVESGDVLFLLKMLSGLHNQCDKDYRMMTITYYDTITV